MDELIDDLRYHEHDYPALAHGPLCGRAADEIERLQTERDGLAQGLAYQESLVPHEQVAYLHEAINHLKFLLTGALKDAERDLDTIDRLRAALSEFATSENWHMGGRFDPNSPRFDGQGFAQHALESSTVDE